MGLFSWNVGEGVLHLDEVVYSEGSPEDEGEDDHPVAHVVILLLRRGFRVEGEVGEEEEDLEADAHDQLDRVQWSEFDSVCDDSWFCDDIWA